VKVVCRIAVILGDKSSSDMAIDVLRAFISASKSEIFSERIKSHKDGWGYVAMTFRDDQRPISVVMYKSAAPVFSDVMGVKQLEEIIRGSERYIIVMHSRAASYGRRNVHNAHPFHLSGKEYDMWIVHNGTMYRERLLELLNKKLVGEISDTYFLGEYIYRSVDSPCVQSLVNAFSSVKGLTKSAMITASLLYEQEDEKVHLFVTNYYTKNGKYYTLYLLDMRDEGLLALYSSTVGHYLARTLDPSKDVLGQEISNGKYLYTLVPGNFDVKALTYVIGPL